MSRTPSPRTSPVQRSARLAASHRRCRAAAAVVVGRRDWVILGFEVVHGRSPSSVEAQRPDAVADALGALADAEPLPGHELPRTDDLLAGDFTGWRKLTALDDEDQARYAEWPATSASGRSTTASSS